MPLQQSEAVILRTYPIGEQDKLVVLFSRDKGVLKGVAKGARKFGNRFGSSLEPMSLVQAFYYEKERQDLVTISNCDLVESYFDVQKDLGVACALSYIAELVEEFSPDRAHDDLLYRLLLTLLKGFQARGDIALLVRYFESWFLRINGWLPDFKRCRRCRKALTGPGWLSPKRDGVYCEACAAEKRDPVGLELQAFTAWAKKNAPLTAPDPSFSPAALDAAGRAHQHLIIYHLEKEPRTLRFLKEGQPKGNKNRS
jgi:DNA repair protein RecO (recombination protein O)